MESPLDLRILGPVEVASGGRRTLIEGRRARVLLAMLLVRRNQTVSLDALIDGLWPAGPPSSARTTLHAHISRLRGALAAAGPLGGAERIGRKPPGYELRTLDGEVDADRFERMLAAAESAMRDGRFAGAAEALREALTLIRGPVLGECHDDPFAQAEVARLEALRVRAVERRIDAGLALGAHAVLVGEIEGQVAAHPLHERFREQLMLALYRSGRQADALAAYQDAYQVLADELGLTPGPGLRSMEAAILKQDPALGYVPAQSARIAPVSAAAVSAGPAPRDRLPFVGRRRARAILDEAWRGARDGERRVIIVEGEPGIGKTRLATEAAAAASADGAPTLLGRAVGDALVPFYPFVEAIRSYAGRLDGGQWRSIAGPGAPYLASLLPDLGPDLLPDLGPEIPRPRRGAGAEAEASSHRYLMFEAVVALLAAIAAPAGAVLILDDMHQADPSAMRLFEHVARHAAPARLLVIATVTTPPPAAAVFDDLTAAGLADRVTLDGLSAGEVGELLAAATGRNGGTPAALAGAVAELSEGVPLFVAEIGKGLAELDDRQVQALAADLPTTERIQAVIDRRLSRVAPFVTSLLSTAAVIGSDFGPGVLAALCHQPQSSVAGQLEAAAAAGLISEDAAAGQYRFAHQLVHRTLLERVGPQTQARLQGELAAFLTGPDAPAGTSPARVAHHFAQAARFHARQAVTYGIRAGDHAMTVLAFEDAARLYQGALASLRGFDTPEPGLEARIHLALGRAQQAAYQRTDSMTAFRRACELAVPLGDGDVLADAVWGLMETAEFSTTDAAAVDLVRRALRSADPGDGSLRARLTAGLAKVLPSGEPEAIALAGEAVALARGLGQPATLAWVLSAALFVTWTPDNFGWRLAAAGEVIDAAGEADWEQIAVDARVFRSAMFTELARFERADEDRAAVERWAAETQRPFYRALATMWRAERALMRGRYAQAEDESAQMVTIGSESPDFFSAYGAHLLLIRRDQGRLAEIDELVAGLLAQAPHVPAWQVARAVVDSGLGRRAAARDRLAALAAGRAAGLPRDWLWLLTTTILADVCADLAALRPAGDPAGDLAGAAGDLRAALAPFSGRIAVLGHGIATTGAVDGPLGRLETVLSDWPAAERHLTAAMALDREAGAVPALARAQLGYAELLLRRGGPGDRDAARRLLAEAAAAAGSIGMAGLEPALRRARAAT